MQTLDPSSNRIFPFRWVWLKDDGLEESGSGCGCRLRQGICAVDFETGIVKELEQASPVWGQKEDGVRSYIATKRALPPISAVAR
jgi:hypothetical protein